MRHARKLFRMTVIAATLALPLAARAECDGCVVGAVNGASAAITGAIAQMETAIVYVLNGIASILGGQTNVQTGNTKQTIQALDEHREATKNEEALQRSAVLQFQKTNELMPTPVGCAAATDAQMMSGGGASAAAQAAVMAQTLQAYRSRSDLNNYSARLQAHSADSQQCDEIDVMQKRPGCSSVGARAGADLTVASLFAGAGTGTAQTPPNLSFTKEQMAAAQRALANVAAANPAPLIDPNAEQTPAGKGYVALSNTARARSSIVQDALAWLLARRLPANVGGGQLPAGVQASWDQYADVFARVYPGRQRPPVPSEWEAMKLAVMRRLDPDYTSALQNTPDSKAVLVELAGIEAQANYLKTTEIEGQEKMIVLLAGILAHLTDPVDKGALADQRNAAMRAAGAK